MGYDTVAKKYDKNNIDRCSLQYKEKKWSKIKFYSSLVTAGMMFVNIILWFVVLLFDVDLWISLRYIAVTFALELVAFVVMVISFWKFRRIERNRKH